MSIAHLLRARTAAVHRRLESGLDLLDPQLTPARLGAVLTRFTGYWSAVEPVLDAWAGIEPELATRLQWPRRRRTELLRADVVALGGSAAVPVATPPFAVADTAATLGWLYVAEGATLGGAVIARRLAARPDASIGRLRSFTPYAEGPGPMWQLFTATAQQWVAGRPDRAPAVADAAEAAFDGLAAWLAPLPVGHEPDGHRAVGEVAV